MMTVSVSEVSLVKHQWTAAATAACVRVKTLDFTACQRRRVGWTPLRQDSVSTVPMKIKSSELPRPSETDSSPRKDHFWSFWTIQRLMTRSEREELLLSMHATGVPALILRWNNGLQTSKGQLQQRPEQVLSFTVCLPAKLLFWAQYLKILFYCCYYLSECMVLYIYTTCHSNTESGYNVGRSAKTCEQCSLHDKYSVPANFFTGEGTRGARLSHFCPKNTPCFIKKHPLSFFVISQPNVVQWQWKLEHIFIC